MPQKLIVEDVSGIPRSSSRGSSEHGAVVTAAGTAVQAIRAGTAEPPDAVLLDAGADYYLVESRSVAQALARVHAVLRRTGPEKTHFDGSPSRAPPRQSEARALAGRQNMRSPAPRGAARPALVVRPGGTTTTVGPSVGPSLPPRTPDG